MILDLTTKFSDAQAVTATAFSTNVLDLRNQSTPTLVDESLNGSPEPLWLVVQVGTAFTAAGAATMQIDLMSDSTADLATSPTTHLTVSAIAVATLIAGYQALATYLPGGTTYERYLGVKYTIATGPMTAGTITAFLTPNIQRNVIYPVGFSVT